MLSRVLRCAPLFVVVGLASVSACSSFDGAENAPADDAGAAAETGSGSSSGITGTAADSSTPTRDAGKDAATWSPAQLPGLSVWLDANVDVFFDTANTVTAWRDQSGQLNNAKPTAPCYDNPGGVKTIVACVGPTKDPASLNGHDTLKFGPKNYLSIADTDSMQFGTGDFAVFMVASISPSFAGSALWNKADVADDIATPYPGALMVYYDGLNLRDRTANGAPGADGASTGLDDGTFRTLGGARRGNVLEVWVNGQPDAKVTLDLVSDVSVVGAPARLGGQPYNSVGYGMTGNIAEAVVVKGTISDADIALLDAYFKTKWGL